VLGLTTIVATWQPTSVVLVAHSFEVPFAGGITSSGTAIPFWGAYGDALAV
jgi:hypothetical protein